LRGALLWGRIVRIIVIVVIVRIRSILGLFAGPQGAEMHRTRPQGRRFC
jgi:hypothetical protein